MSSPWRFAGTWFPSMESVVSTVGAGTDYPLIWNRVNGAIDASQMCQWEWTTKTVSSTCSGTATLLFVNPSDPTDTETHTITFSMSASDTPDTGTDWSVLEPSNITAGGRHFSLIGGDLGTISTSWGTGSWTASLTISISDLATVSGTGFANYVKKLNIQISAASDSGDVWGVNSFNSGGLSFVQNVPAFHGNVAVYDIGGASGSISSFTLTVTDKFIQPANI